MFVEHKEQGELPSRVSEVAQYLLKAAAYIEEHGWCQNHINDAAGRVCLAGAIYAVGGGFLDDGIPKRCPVRSEAFDAIRNALPDCTFRIPAWNDAPGRTQDEVVAKIRAVAFGL